MLLRWCGRPCSHLKQECILVDSMMRTACLLTYPIVSHVTCGGGDLPTPNAPPPRQTPNPGCRPPPHPLVMWHVMHAGKPIPPPLADRQTPVKTVPCPKLSLRAVIIVVLHCCDTNWLGGGKCGKNPLVLIRCFTGEVGVWGKLRCTNLKPIWSPLWGDWMNL